MLDIETKARIDFARIFQSQNAYKAPRRVLVGNQLAEKTRCNGSTGNPADAERVT
jgi:hypothetical protein